MFASSIGSLGGTGGGGGSSRLRKATSHAMRMAVFMLSGQATFCPAMSNAVPIIDVRKFGGLRRVLPWTCWTFVIGSLALAGFPFFSGFFSKDEIIHAAFRHHAIFGIMGLATALLTAFYTFRMVFLAFWGEKRVPEGVHPHESGPWMLVPLVLLAVGAIGAGYVGVSQKVGGFAGFIEPHGAFHHFLAPAVTAYRDAREQVGTGTLLEVHRAGDGPARLGETHYGVSPNETHHGASTAEGHALMYLSGLISIAGIAAAWYLYVWRRDLSQRVAEGMPKLHDLLLNKYYVDEWNDATIVKPLWKSGRAAYSIDTIVVDGALWLIAAVPRALGALLRPLQDGLIHSYGMTMTAGLLLVVFIVLWLR